MPLNDAGALHVPAMRMRGRVSARNWGNHRNSQSHRNGLLRRSLHAITYILLCIIYTQERAELYSQQLIDYSNEWITYSSSIIPRSEKVPSGILRITLPSKFLR